MYQSKKKNPIQETELTYCSVNETKQKKIK